jgi:hypothetical protein
VSLPSADDQFRPTDPTAEELAAEAHVRAVPDTSRPEPSKSEAPGKRRPSGRVRHDEKMTVYVTAEELLDLEHARLSLRRHQGLAVDRGRLVREAIAIALEDLEANGDDSVLVQRLHAR